MTIQEMALNVLNGTRFSFQTQWEIPQRKKDRIAERFKLVWSEPATCWITEDDAALLYNGHYAPSEDAREIDGRWYHVNELNHCESCDELELPCNLHRVRVNNRRQLWCSPCTDADTFYCEGCEHTYHNDEAVEHFNGTLYCRDCIPEEENSVHSYHSQSRPRIPHDKLDYPFWSLELELELESENERDEFAREIQNDPRLKRDQIILEKDGSLCHETGVEVIFSLFESKEDLLRNVALVQEKARNCGGLSWQLKSKRGRWAGCHINRNRQGWRERDLMRLCFLVERLRSQLITLSGRNCTDYASYSDCYYGTRGRRLRDLARGTQGKYSALNLSSGNRIEWRMFSGSLKPQRIAAYCDCVEALEIFAKSDIPAHLLIEKGRYVLAAINNRFNK